MLSELIVKNLPVLPVIVPMLAAAFCALTKRENIAWLIAISAVMLSFVAIVTLVIATRDGNIVSLALGNHAAPFGIDYKIDALNSAVMLLVGAIGLVVMLFARKNIALEIPRSKRALFYTMFLLCYAGLLGITATNDIFNIYVFIEISSLATYTLVALGKNRRALMAAYEYLILGTIGATFYLIGVGFIYISVGSLNITDIAMRMHEFADTTPIEVAFVFIVLGICMKMAIFPLHMWLTEAYSYAPTVVSSFLSATATKVMAYVLLRCLYDVFGYHFSFNTMLVADILVILGLIAIVVGSLTAIYQPNGKRLLAFSSVAQLGYIILAIGIATHPGLVAAIVHLFNHAASKSLLFLCLGCIMLRIGSTRIVDMRGIAKAMPITMICFVIGAMSLVGIPGTAGFISKWHMFMAVFDAELHVILVIFVVSSLLALLYAWKIIDAAFFHEPTMDLTEVKDPSCMMKIVLILMACGNIYLGFDTRVTLDLAVDAAEILYPATEIIAGGN